MHDKTIAKYFNKETNISLLRKISVLEFAYSKITATLVIHILRIFCHKHTIGCTLEIFFIFFIFRNLNYKF